MEVTATRVPSPLQEVPFSVDRLGTGSFRGESGVSLDEALRELPGVAVSDRGNLSQGDRVSIRGIGSRASFGVRGIRVLVDDVPLTMPDGQSQLNNLDLHAVGDVEVLRGPSSWLYGNAAGGVIHFRTRPPRGGGRGRAGGDRRFRGHEAGAGVSRPRALGTRSRSQRRPARARGLPRSRGRPHAPLQPRRRPPGHRVGRGYFGVQFRRRPLPAESQLPVPARPPTATRAAPASSCAPRGLPSGCARGRED